MIIRARTQVTLRVDEQVVWTKVHVEPLTYVGVRKASFTFGPFFCRQVPVSAHQRIQQRSLSVHVASNEAQDQSAKRRSGAV